MTHPQSLKNVPHTAEPQHEHAWIVESAHKTSEGTVLYTRCALACGGRRIEMRDLAEIPPHVLSTVVGCA